MEPSGAAPVASDHLPPRPASAGLFFEPLLLDQADVAAVSRQVHLALFYDARLDIGAMKA